MPTYRIGAARGRPMKGKTPSAVVCETCNEELGATAPVESGQERFSGLTPAGIVRIWPELESAVQTHEARCWGKKS
jgi:hypothetical protein